VRDKGRHKAPTLVADTALHRCESFVSRVTNDQNTHVFGFLFRLQTRSPFLLGFFAVLSILLLLLLLSSSHGA